MVPAIAFFCPFLAFRTLGTLFAVDFVYIILSTRNEYMHDVEWLFTRRACRAHFVRVSGIVALLLPAVARRTRS